MAYATVEDIQARMTNELSESERSVCATLLDDAAVIIDEYNAEASEDVKKVVSCRMVTRAVGVSDLGIPMGASQGSQSGLGYAESWTIGSGGAVGELYLGKLEKKLLGKSNQIGSHSPLEDISGGVIWP